MKTLRTAFCIGMTLSSFALGLPKFDYNETTRRCQDSSGNGGMDLCKDLATCCYVTGAKLAGGNYSGKTFRQIQIGDADLTGADFSKTTFLFAKIWNSDFTGAIFKEARLDETEFSHVKLDKADFSEAHGKPEFLDCSAKEASFENIQIYGWVIDGGDFSRTSFRRSFLNNCNWSGANFAGADFTKARMDRVKLAGADLRNARFNRAQLNKSNLSRADIRGASFESISTYETPMESALFDSKTVPYGADPEKSEKLGLIFIKEK